MESVIELEKGCNYEEALSDLKGVERIWVVFVFHKAGNWKPRITPPRGDGKRGLFSTRSPHRPNPIGISAVKLKKVDGLKLYIEDHDFIDGTPVLDIKPYLPYVDSHPSAACGWLENIEASQPYELVCEERFTKRQQWLLENDGPDLFSLVDVNLCIHPLPKKGNRISQLNNGDYVIAVKTWRITYSIEGHRVLLKDIFGGYEEDYLNGVKQSKWDDIELHKKFLSEFSQKET